MTNTSELNELNELVKNLTGNSGEKILETLLTLEVLLSGQEFKNLKNDVAELKDAASVFGSQLTNNLQQIKQINHDGLANFDNANNALSNNVEQLNNISTGLADAIFNRLHSPETAEKIQLTLGKNVQIAVDNLSTRFKESIEKDEIIENMHSTVVNAIKEEAEKLAVSLVNDPGSAPAVLVHATEIFRKTARTKDETIKNLNQRVEAAEAMAIRFRDFFNNSTEIIKKLQGGGNFFYKTAMLSGVSFVVINSIFKIV